MNQTFLGLALVFLLGLAACEPSTGGNQMAVEVVSAELTQSPTHTAVPTPTATLQPPTSAATFTPIPPTATHTQVPTATPTSAPLTIANAPDLETLAHIVGRERAAAHWADWGDSVRPAMQAAGWLADTDLHERNRYPAFMTSHLNPENSPSTVEWIVQVVSPATQPVSTPRGWRQQGNLWIFGRNELDFHFHPNETAAEQLLLPNILSVADFTHDPRDDIYRAAGNAADAACSFSADTLVMTIDGLKPISAVAVGELVLAYNEETGEVGYYPVIASWEHTDPVIVHLTVDGETIQTTLEHPFYTDDNEWVAAGSLQIGDELRSADWQTSTIEAIHISYTPQLMYNFTVAEAHTYFVGYDSWLVHNACQIHHAISNKIRRALNRHSVLAGVFDRESPLLKYVASTEEAHRGYQRWHRQYDAQVVEWLQTNPNASREQFLNYLKWMYSQEDIAWRFPDAIKYLDEMIEAGR